ncbi:fumarate hydratase subunit beta [Clostridium acetobutylicum]|uniref:Fumarate hydratase, subunit B (C-terminal domain of FumA E.coli) class I n=1 Tax=Clostridium acetobutylicum (strain ATCC 824 / DSM 792 / JCM 1419 / IAM 19013 / LMG 5710 / NBRC 13948 / NRRL B-527 / VKM B-1787 / 2291 / W) TaxID=272562 RepID=Q97EM0_CLOAB|nr:MULTISPECIES: Fe-S-containing hydro-lyase [Clostridium]AAK81030.1 Fumarate hydratase, subunit B (C-terminal domain of FumA E.coli) class I [Clostridium acetobutylicum ATCC 824]ADZ22133.1 fumarate hydratase [Clostridium acetobutylicum EA 2018]AEI33540.1 fumarate hydratase [Clostridium acetobutylicum DSM 1731]AWV78559.1 Fe-S-containing hydro-lyase [Clostridium acetobutylicum]KHD35717.1 fumarate hydratase [Clostridium acetobutylicum]
MEKLITSPIRQEEIQDLRAGDRVLISGYIYTARDAAHKRLIELLNEGKDLPIDIQNQIIYYAGPTPAKPGKVIGSAGPTTSGRMDAFAPRLLDMGLKGMIGKGARSKEVVESIIKNKAVYFGAVGGAAALISKSIVESKIIAYSDLGSEAIRKLKVIKFPAVVIIDTVGNNLYEIGRKSYLDKFVHE